MRHAGWRSAAGADTALLADAGLLAQTLGFFQQVALVIIEVAIKGADLAAADKPELVAHGAQQGRSWLTSITVPSNSLSAMARASRVARSRWLVGSSSSSRLGRCQTIMASTRRAFSPPLMLPTACSTMSPLKLNDPEEVAQILFARVHAQLARQAHHVPQRVIIRVQHIEFLLGEVANRQAFALGDLAESGAMVRAMVLTSVDLPAVGAQNADALAGQHRFADAGEDGALGAVFTGVAKGRIGQRQRRLSRLAGSFESK